MVGKPNEFSFFAGYIREEEVVALASLAFDPTVANFAEILRTGGSVSLEQFDENSKFLFQK